MKTLLFVLAASVACSRADLVISEIDLANNKVEIINSGPGSENLTGYWLCNLWKGSPVYVAVTSAMIVAAESSTATLSMPAGAVVTLQSTASFITDAQGEVGLYSTNSFGSATAMVDYVSWGGNSNNRDAVAATKGIWVEGSFVDVTGITAGQTIQLGLGLAGNSKDDYGLAASTIGSDQVYPPAAVELRIGEVNRSGDTLTVNFTGPAEVAPAAWQVQGGAGLAAFPDDKTSSATITESPASSGIYQAVIDLSGAGGAYFVRIVLP